MQLAQLIRSRRWTRTSLLLAAWLAIATPAASAVPGQVNYQGLLLDASGNTITGSVDLSFALFDAPSGGDPLWTESHPGVEVLDGVYEVSLGASEPLTPELLAISAVYLEIAVEGETLAPRQRLLAVPYAIAAEQANSVGALSALAATQMYQHFAFDGGNPPNDDPREGTADTDLDGVANYLDSDNDADGISDTAELAQNSDINLVTPVLGTATPATGRHCLVTNVLVQGANFQPGLSVSFGSQMPAPTNLSPTSFDVAVGPQAIGPATVTATNTNGEQDAASLFSFIARTPSISSIVPPTAAADSSTTVTVHGSGFDPGLTVSFGSATPTPTNVTSTQFDVVVGPQPVGVVSVVVTNVCGETSQSNFSFGFDDRKIAFVSSATYSGNLGGIAGADAKCNALAAAANLTGTYMAWLSDGATDPATRFVRNAPYVLTSGDQLADDWNDLTDGSIDLPIWFTETGAFASSYVYTNVAPNGTTASASAHCDGWTSSDAGDAGGQGRSIWSDSNWTDARSAPCGGAERIYCFEQ
ncbi:MAG TPA: IPT/TIG domain-containing protein [Myxococcota bacterium]|nr:IPT/TIG domain-containing protein [Myxococcota bacterium]